MRAPLTRGGRRIQFGIYIIYIYIIYIYYIRKFSYSYQDFICYNVKNIKNKIYYKLIILIIDLLYLCYIIISYFIYHLKTKNHAYISIYHLFIMGRTLVESYFTSVVTVCFFGSRTCNRPDE